MAINSVKGEQDSPSGPNPVTQLVTYERDSLKEIKSGLETTALEQKVHVQTEKTETREKPKITRIGMSEVHNGGDHPVAE